MFTKIKAVRVQEVIMSGSASIIGNIKYNNIDEGKPINTNNLPTARPLFKNITQIPAVNEIIYILGAPKDDYNSTSTFYTYLCINENGKIL